MVEEKMVEEVKPIPLSLVQKMVIRAFGVVPPLGVRVEKKYPSMVTSTPEEIFKWNTIVEIRKDRRKDQSRMRRERNAGV